MDFKQLAPLAVEFLKDFSLRESCIPEDTAMNIWLLTRAIKNKHPNELNEFCKLGLCKRKETIRQAIAEARNMEKKASE